MRRIAGDIKKGEFARAYILYGDERYLLRMYLEKLLSALDATDGNMSFNRFEGKQISENEIIDACETMPFFSDRRIVYIEDSGLFKGKKGDADQSKDKNERLTEYFKELPDYLTVIFSESEVDKRGKFYKTVAEYDRSVEFKALNEGDITNWVLAELKKNGKKIRKSVIELFLNGCGDDLGFISCELEKLISYTGEREEITAQDINAICSPKVENRIFDMISNMAAGRRDKALSVYYDLILLKEPPMKMLVLMERQFRQLLDMRQLISNGQGEKFITEKLKMNPYAVKKNMPLARKYSEKQIREILEEMVRLDEDVKSGRINDRMAVELMLMRA